MLLKLWALYTAKKRSNDSLEFWWSLVGPISHAVASVLATDEREICFVLAV